MRGFEMGEKKEKRGLILTDVICSEARALEAFRGKALPGGSAGSYPLYPPRRLRSVAVSRSKATREL